MVKENQRDLRDNDWSTESNDDARIWNLAAGVVCVPNPDSEPLVDVDESDPSLWMWE